MSKLGTYVFVGMSFKSSASTQSVFATLGTNGANTMAVATEADTGYQTTSLAFTSPTPEPSIDVVLSGLLTLTMTEEREVSFVVSCGRDYPTGGYITLVSNEVIPVVNLGPVQVSTPQFTTSTRVTLPKDYSATLLLKLNFTGGEMPSTGATITVNPSVIEENPDTRVPSMIKIGQQTIAF